MFKYFFLVIFYPLFAQATGQEVGNGGKFVLCSDRQYYFYDYVVTVNNQFGAIQSQLNFKQSVQQIIRNLQRLNDPLAIELQEFMSILYQQIPGKKYQWFAQTNLPYLWNPGGDQMLPAQCNKVKKQAALFTAPYADIAYISYMYDFRLIAQVQSQKFGDIQVSMLWVHEWLWNHFSIKNFLKLAYFNRLLHSEKMNSITAMEYSKIKSELLK
ncbi:MAG: hypothetical protein AABY64_03040 [Bdellovibrionota bacterium]